MSEENKEELFARLRETEAQTREQNVKLEALANHIEKLSDINREYISLLREQMDKADKREQVLVRTIYILVGALIALALGMKYAEKIVAASGGVACMRVDIAPWHPEEVSTWRLA